MFVMCTHRLISLFDGAVDRHRKKSKDIARWENLSFTICANFDVKKQLKFLVMAFDQDLTCFIFPLRLAHLPIQK